MWHFLIIWACAWVLVSAYLLLEVRRMRRQLGEIHAALGIRPQALEWGDTLFRAWAHDTDKLVRTISVKLDELIEAFRKGNHEALSRGMREMEAIREKLRDY